LLASSPARLKNIGAISSTPRYPPGCCPGLEKILKKGPFDWELIARNYDQRVTYANETEAADRRDEPGAAPASPRAAAPQQPRLPRQEETRAAGRCGHLRRRRPRRPELRARSTRPAGRRDGTRQRQDILRPRRGVITGDDREHAEVSLLALHLLQSRLVCSNTSFYKGVRATRPARESSPRKTGAACPRCSASHVKPWAGPSRHGHSPRPHRTHEAAWPHRDSPIVPKAALRLVWYVNVCG